MKNPPDVHDKVRVFLDVAPWDFRSRNTDWRYVRHMLPRLAEWEPSLDLVLQTSSRITLQYNYKAIRMALGRRVGHPLELVDCETDLLDAAELKRSGCEMVFSHRGYPMNAGDTPVIWQSSILDPEMSKFYLGETPARLTEDEIRHTLFQRAATVQVSTAAEAVRLSKTYPELAGRFTPIPFFLPNLQAAPEESLDRHRAPEKIEILFVGNEPRRKGLDLLLTAFQQLPATLRSHAHLTIISNFDGAAVSLPGSADITLHKGLPHAEVLRLMHKAHVLVNVARFESYGFIFPEAMSQGVVCLGPDWEVQRELLDSGRAGVNIGCDVDLLQAALAQLIEDDAHRLALATAAWNRFLDKFAPSVVARQYASMFHRVKSLSNV